MKRVYRGMKNIFIILAGIAFPYVMTYWLSLIGIVVEIEMVSAVFVLVLAGVVAIHYVIDSRENRKLLAHYKEAFEQVVESNKRKDVLIDMKNETIDRLQQNLKRMMDLHYNNLFNNK